MVLLLTGKRRKELGLARWKDIDFVNKRWRIPPEHSKNGFEDMVLIGRFASWKSSKGWPESHGSFARVLNRIGQPTHV